MSDETNENAYNPCEAARELSAQNEHRLRRFAQQGVQLDNAQLLGTRVQAILDWIWGPEEGPDGEPNYTRGEFELKLQKTYAAMLDDVQTQINRAKLTQGIVLPK